MNRRFTGALLAIGLTLVAPAVRAESPAEIAATPDRWPREVMVKSSVRGTLIENGQRAGAVLIGAGRTLGVISVGADGLTAKLGTSVVLVPAEKTDLLERLGGAPATAPAAKSPTASAAVAAPAVKPAAATAAPTASAVPPMMERMLADKLMRLDGGKLQAVPNGALRGVRYYALYYSAKWCGPCRAFTPQLVRAYRELKAKHPEFEVVFVSADRSGGEMVRYMTDDRMPFPAVGFDKRDNKILSYAGPGIPCLVLVDEKGRVLSDSYEGDNYVGPQKVLRDLQRTLGE